MKNSLKRNSGFTLLEVISVLVILGIISTLVVSRISINIDDIKRDEQLNILKTHLRYAQSRAMNSDFKWSITLDSDKYWLFEGTDIEENRRRFPGIIEEDEHEDEAKSVSLIGSGLTIDSALQTIIFDVSGSPVDTDGNSVAVDIIIDTSGDNIIITANTGFIP